MRSSLWSVVRGYIGESLSESGERGVAVDLEQVGRVAGVAPIFGEGEFVTVGGRESFEPLVVVVFRIDEGVDLVSEAVLAATCARA